MEYISLSDTALDLNADPPRFMDDFWATRTALLVEELNRVNVENKKLTEMLTVVCENYNALRAQMVDIKNKNNNNSDNTNNNPVTGLTTVTKKRKTGPSTGIHENTTNGVNNSDSSSSDDDSSCKKKIREEYINPIISKAYVQTQASDTTLIVKDGYQWRKYGQKVTRDNPSPRAYYKCSFAPGCPVKKKVQRSVEDQSVLVATYEGEHNHPNPSKIDAMSKSSKCMTIGSVPCSASVNSSGPTITLDLTKSKSHSIEDAKNSNGATNSSEFQRFLVEQMATSLTKDPGFKAALAAAISGNIVSQY